MWFLLKYWKYIAVGGMLVSSIALTSYSIHKYIEDQVRIQNLQIALQAANKQVELNAALQEENARYVSQISATEDKYNELRTSILKGVNDDLLPDDSSLNGLLNAISVLCKQSADDPSIGNTSTGTNP